LATYAIGDIQGCYNAFQALLARLNFKPLQDELWLVGDLINRGSGSLEVLRWCYQHQHCIKVVLGNHDLHALAVAHGIKPPHRSDTLASLIEATDTDELLTWLRYQPLLIADSGYVMVHAGLLPQWQLCDALSYSNEVQAALQHNDFKSFLSNMYGNTPVAWHDDLVGYDRLRAITNAMTRMRICTAHGALEFTFKGELKDIPAGYMPWFDVPTRKTKDIGIVCGHWSALGLQQRANIYALDTGCLWGGKLTAMCLETKLVTQVPFDVKDKPLKI
jgi:bis(5'-nucleosyl)-tetraphosphatase (symmetrical)